MILTAFALTVFVLLSEKQLPSWVSQFAKEKSNEAKASAGKHTLPVRKVRGRWLAGRPQYAKPCWEPLHQMQRQLQRTRSQSWLRKSPSFERFTSIGFPFVQFLVKGEGQLNATVWVCFHIHLGSLMPAAEHQWYKEALLTRRASQTAPLFEAKLFRHFRRISRASLWWRK